MKINKKILKKNIASWSIKNRRCLHPNCNNMAISSHQVSKSQLKHIEDCNNRLHIVRPNFGQILYAEKQATLYVKSRVSDSLVFKGFCHKCDQQIFKELDNPSNSYSIEIIILQSYRSLCYHYREYEIQYRSLLDTWNEQGVVSSVIPTWRIHDTRIAKNLLEEWGYIKAGFENYKSQFEQTIWERGNNFSIHKCRVLPSTTELRYGGSIYLNIDLWGNSLGLNHNNSGYFEPLVFWQFLKFDGEMWLSNLVLKQHESYSANLFSQLKSLNPNQLCFHLIRYFSVSNLGYAGSLTFNQQLTNSYKDQINDIENDYLTQLHMGSKQNWKSYFVPDEFPELHIID